MQGYSGIASKQTMTKEYNWFGHLTRQSFHPFLNTAFQEKKSILLTEQQLKGYY
jgi:hypothetical protein